MVRIVRCDRLVLTPVNNTRAHHNGRHLLPIMGRLTQLHPTVKGEEAGQACLLTHHLTVRTATRPSKAHQHHTMLVANIVLMAHLSSISMGFSLKISEVPILVTAELILIIHLTAGSQVRDLHHSVAGELIGHLSRIYSGLPATVLALVILRIPKELKMLLMMRMTTSSDLRKISK